MDSEIVDKIKELVTSPYVIDIDPERRIAIVSIDTKVEDLSKFLPPPSRIRQKVTLLTVESFIAYVNEFANEASVIFANEPAAKYEAVIDYHQAPDGDIDEARGTCEHVAAYECPLSDEWKLWVGSHGGWFDQETFARMLERSFKEIVEPPAADFVQLALQLQIHKAAAYSSELKLESGETKFRYEEDIRGNKKTGDIAIPAQFRLALPVFIGGAVFPVTARFRYRLNEGKLSLGYELIRHTDVYRAAVSEVTKQIGTATAALYVGTRG